MFDLRLVVARLLSTPSSQSGLATVSGAPARGSSNATSAPLSTICRSVRTSSIAATPPKVRPPALRMACHSAHVRVANTASSTTTSARAFARRAGVVAKRPSEASSGRSMARSNAGQSRSSFSTFSRNQRPSLQR